MAQTTLFAGLIMVLVVFCFYLELKTILDELGVEGKVQKVP